MIYGSVWENVPGVLSLDGGRAFASILGGLAECGYGLAYRVLDAQFVRVDGFGRAVPQRRRRVFVVGYLGDWRRAAAVLFERSSLSRHPPPRRQAGQIAAPTISARPTGGGGLGTDFECDGGLVAFGGNNTSGPIDVATAQTAHGGSGRFDFESETFVAHALRGEVVDASEDGTGRGTPLVPVAVDVAPCLRSGGNVTGGDRPYPSSGVAWRVRRLMPIECERLQGFPDGYTAVPYPLPKWAPKFPERVKYAADGPRYKALGNSMAVNCMRWIGRRIDMVEAQRAGRHDQA